MAGGDGKYIFVFITLILSVLEDKEASCAAATDKQDKNK